MATDQQTEALERPDQRQLTQMDIMVEQAMRVEGLSGSERLALIDKIEGVYLRRRKEEAEQAFNKALSSAQALMETIPAESLNPQTRSHYAKYAAVDKHIRPIYTDHGFALTFRQGEGAPPEHMRLVCRLSHKGGHVEFPYLDLPVDGKGAKGGDVMTKTHATGAGVSYGKRYLAGMIFNLAFTDDNDGNPVRPKLNDAEQSNLKKMMKGFSQERVSWLLNQFDVSELSELPRSKYNNAMDRINQAIQKDAKQAATQKQDGKSKAATVSMVQEANLMAVIEGIGGTCKQDFLTANQIAKVSDLPAHQYTGALEALNQLRSK